MTKDRVFDRQEKTHVLVVAEEPIVRYGLSQLIKRQSDLEVCGELDTGDRILEEITIRQTDLLIIDFFLIPTGIFHLLETILSQYPKLKILVLSRYDEFLYAHRILKLGAKGYIKQEASIDQMLAAMRQILRGELFVSPTLKEVFVDSIIGTPPNAPIDSLDTLSDRELEVFHLLGKGYTTVEIAATLHRSIKTIDAHRIRIKKKLKPQSTPQLIQQAVQWITQCSPAG